MPPTGAQGSHGTPADLIAQVRAGRTVRARHTTMLNGLLKGVTAANRSAGGTQSPAVTAWIAEQTPLINQYCDAMENTGTETSTGAGMEG